MSKRSILLFVLAFITPIIITHQAFAACCVGTTGNVDGSGDGVADISDVFAMVDHLGSSLPLSNCVDENDVNIDGTVDISDLFAIIDYLSGATPLAPCPTMTDIDGNIYPTVTIGTQVWMAENLKVIHYRNGDSIPHVTENSSWASLASGACGEYNCDINHVTTYGRLYNWFAVNDSRSIAPAGWHIPSDAEWQTLVNYLGGNTAAGGKMKETGLAHWHTPNKGATNESGFRALPGGMIASIMGDYTFFWSADGFSGGSAFIRRLACDYSDIDRIITARENAISVRCVKD